MTHDIKHIPPTILRMTKKLMFNNTNFFTYTKNVEQIIILKCNKKKKSPARDELQLPVCWQDYEPNAVTSCA